MKLRVTVLLLFACLNSREQTTEETDPVMEQQMEQLAERSDADIKDDSYWQQLDNYSKHPIDLNHVSEEELQSTGMLTGLQVSNFFRYRSLLGKLVAVQELQAIPAWDMETIRKLLPYIRVNAQEPLAVSFHERWKGGQQNALTRVSQVPEKSKGFGLAPDSSRYLGSPQQLFVRYTYNYRNLLQYGWLGDKDAGEQFFRGHERYGFDFYSFHFFMRKNGIVKSLALGDFTVNMGQGLIQWQGMAFTKSANVLAIKRQADVLAPYHAAGEFNFHRGAGITLQKAHWQAGGFISLRNISAREASDTAGQREAVSSFDNSGYHRTLTEIARKGNTKQQAAGASIRFSGEDGSIAVNMVQYHFSRPVQKQQQPYNLFAISGKSWANYSLDYSYTYHNIHFFGEAAIDRQWHSAFVNAAVISLAPDFDAAFLYRNINRAYQALYANAFTENTAPNNEKGGYAGLSARPFAGCRLDIFFDLYTFPWLKYAVDAPSYGEDFFISFSYQPSKRWSFYTHFKNENKEGNVYGEDLATHPLAFTPKKDWRMEVTADMGKIIWRSRVECLWYNKNTLQQQEGFLGLMDLLYRPHSKSFSGDLRLQYFEATGYDARIYVYERDVPYHFSLPAYYGKGFRYYFNLKRRFGRLPGLGKTRKYRLEGWLRWGQVIYKGQSSIGSGLDQIPGNRKSEFTCEFLLTW